MMPVWRSCTKTPAGSVVLTILKALQRRRQRGQHVGLGHGQVDLAKLQQRMAAGEQALGIDVGDGAGGGNIHVATDQQRR